MSPLEPAIGATLRDTRIRRKIDLAQVEAATKIRVRYLRALENEEWDVLPGGAYTRGFIRTYAAFLGLDGERLADEFRREIDVPASDRHQRLDPSPGPRPPRGGDGLPRGAVPALIALALTVALIAIGLLSDGGSSDSKAPPPRQPKSVGGGDGRGAGAKKGAPGVSLKLAARANVWVCLIDAGGAELIGGRVITAGSTKGPFRSGSFTVAFGNGSVAMEIDGKQVPVQDTPNPLGYEIAHDGDVRPLPGARRPTCG